MNISLKRLKSQGFPLQLKITLLSFSLIGFIIMAGGAILIENFSHTLEEELGSKAMAVARTVAQLEEIQDNVGVPGGEAVIQAIAERIRLATNMEYIVVIDMERTRYSHPLQDRIGGKFAGGDEAAALANHYYISRATGVLGPSVRAFAPIKIKEGTQQVGVVVVGILAPTIATLLKEIKSELYFSLAIGLFLGMLGSIFLSHNIKKSMFNMEPNEIARLLEEREAVLQTIDEGIIALDRKGIITLANDEALRLIKSPVDISGQAWRDLIPNSRLHETVKTGVAEYNQPFNMSGVPVLVDRIPIRVKGEIVGALATFKDKSEVHKLAEELTGVKQFIEALRVQNHEYMNKLHTIAGLIQLGRKEEAADYIFSITEEQQELTSFLTKNIRDYKLAGLLLGKYSHAKELKIDLQIDSTSSLTKLPERTDSISLVVVLGNLLENSMEALSQIPAAGKKLFLSIKETPEHLDIILEDNGPGMGEDILSSIFLKGFTTKRDTNQGLGLYLVNKHVQNAGGTIEVHSQPGQGARFHVRIPYQTPDKE